MRERRERGTGRIFRRGATWWIQYYHRGRQIRVSSGETDEKKAAKFLRRKLAEVETGTHTNSQNLRYEDLRESYITDYLVNGRKSLRRDKEGKPRLDAVTRLDGFFCGFKADDIDTDRLRKFVSEQQKAGLSNGSINRSLSALRRMFNIARRDAKMNSLPYFPMLKEAAPRQGFVERNSYQSLLRTLPDYLHLPLSIGYFTGMRLGEILKLKWEQVDFLADTISLYAGTTKNDEGRKTPIPAALRALLLSQHARRHEVCPFVCFRLDRRGHAVKIGGFRKAWYSACIKAGLGKMEPAVDSATGEILYASPRKDRRNPKRKPKMVYRGLIFHDLRRSTVRNLVRSQVPEKVAMGITGHKTRSVFDRYNIVSENDLAEAARKLSAFHENGDNLHRNAAGHFSSAMKS